VIMSVLNTSEYTVERGGFTFPPRTTVVVDVHPYRLLEITASTCLRSTPAGEFVPLGTSVSAFVPVETKAELPPPEVIVRPRTPRVTKTR
jgi:hypothetical protein